MQWSQDDLRDLAARATPLFERIGGAVVPVASTDDDDAGARIEHWRRALGDDTGDRLALRLTFDGLAESACRHTLGRVAWPPDRPLPAWLATLEAILATCRAAPRPTESDANDPAAHGRVPPFADIVRPFARFAEGQLQQRAGPDLAVLSVGAVDDLLADLLACLSADMALALGKQFELQRALHDPLWWVADGEDRDPTLTTRRYAAFADAMLGGGLKGFFQEHPVLARLMVERIDRWVEHGARLCRRLRRDAEAIGQVFRGGRAPGIVTALRPGLSDPHHGGQSVTVITFGEGDGSAWKLVFKPRSLATDTALFGLLGWLNDGAQPLQDFKILKVLDRGNYGFIEHVDHAPCAGPDQLRRYYRRTGMLLCVIWALGGTDCHHENVIACGEFPVLIDTETLVYPRPRRSGVAWNDASADALAGDLVHGSVLSTGLLPVWQAGQNGRSYDLSGLCGDPQQPTGFHSLQWRHANSDQMQLVEWQATTRRLANMPLLGDEAQPPAAFAAEICDGFATMYSRLLARREQLLAADGPLAAFAGCVVRCIMRPSSVYGVLLSRLRHPDLLRDGADRSIEIEMLARAMLPSGGAVSASPAWPLIKAERDAVERGDIPLFTASAADRVLRADNAVVAVDVLSEPSFGRARERVRQLSATDLALQLGYIRAAFAARYGTDGGPPSGPACAPDPDRADDMTPAPEQMIEAAHAIAWRMRELAVTAPDGTATWITPDFDAATERWRLGPMRHMLYSGRCGVALFLAAIESITLGGQFRTLALGAVKPLRAMLREAGGRRLARHIGLGAGDGLGGLIYGFIRIGQLLGENDFIREAHRMVSWMTDDDAREDKFLDVIGGAAGAILALAALYEDFGSDAALARAAACGRRLLSAQSACGGWPTPIASRPLTGFSHGAGGIAYALLRLGRASGEQAFVAAARRGIAYEDSIYCEQQGNWPDYRDGGAAAAALAFATTWCHGAPGIGLARLGGLAGLDTASVRLDIDRAIATTRACALDGPDHLCCGNFGRIELLLEGSRRLGRPDLMVAARRAAAWAVRRAGRTGDYHLHTPMMPGVCAPSLFQGTAGIGYQLLRLSRPDLLPSVLLWA